MSNVIKQQLEKLCKAETTEEELEALRLLNVYLANVHTSHCDPDYIERQFLTQSKTVLEEGNPYPLFRVSLVLQGSLRDRTRVSLYITNRSDIDQPTFIVIFESVATRKELGIITS